MVNHVGLVSWNTEYCTRMCVSKRDRRGVPQGHQDTMRESSIMPCVKTLAGQMHVVGVDDFAGSLTLPPSTLPPPLFILVGL